MHQKVCPNCQQPYPDDYQGRYCLNCGAVFALGPNRRSARVATLSANVVAPAINFLDVTLCLMFSGLITFLLFQTIIVRLITMGS